MFFHVMSLVASAFASPCTPELAHQDGDDQSRMMPTIISEAQGQLDRSSHGFTQIMEASYAGPQIFAPSTVTWRLLTPTEQVVEEGGVCQSRLHWSGGQRVVLQGSFSGRWEQAVDLGGLWLTGGFGPNSNVLHPDPAGAREWIKRAVRHAFFLQSDSPEEYGAIQIHLWPAANREEEIRVVGELVLSKLGELHHTEGFPTSLIIETLQEIWIASTMPAAVVAMSEEHDPYWAVEHYWEGFFYRRAKVNTGLVVLYRVYIARAMYQLGQTSWASSMARSVESELPTSHLAHKAEYLSELARIR